jgi:trigger factor
MENTPVVLPESMVQAELSGSFRNLARKFGVGTDKIMEIFDQSEEGRDSLQQNWRPAVEKALHSRLIVETLIEELHIEAAEDEVILEMEKMADEEGESIEDLEKHYGKGRLEEIIRDDFRERKFFDLLLA